MGDYARERPEFSAEKAGTMIDLRSDTVTLPTQEMKEAMAAALLGDNVLDRDPTTQKLEELAAEITGKEAALFVPSGTMSNQIALATHTRPGDSVLFEDEAHMVYYEGGAPAVTAGVITRGIAAARGVLTPELVEPAILIRSHHTPGTSLICLENTHNRHGGSITTMAEHQALKAVSLRKNVPLHLDGARLFNACVAQNCRIDEIACEVDTLSICLSKGLGSPVGSLLCGSKAFIEEAEFWRKRLGGGMRQIGMLAACGIVSLTKMVDRLVEDHGRASELAALCSELPGLTPLPCQTNILILETSAPAEAWRHELEQLGVRTIPFGPHKLRAVFHYDISDFDLVTIKTAFSSTAAALRAQNT